MNCLKCGKETKKDRFCEDCMKTLSYITRTPAKIDIPKWKTPKKKSIIEQIKINRIKREND